MHSSWPSSQARCSAVTPDQRVRPTGTFSTCHTARGVGRGESRSDVGRSKGRRKENDRTCAGPGYSVVPEL